MKENTLEEKIRLMRVKLQRIEKLLAKRNKKLELEGSLPQEFTNTFEAEIKKMSEENSHLKDYNTKLKAIQRDYATKTVVKKPANSFGHVRGKLPNYKLKQSDQDF